LYQLYYSNIMSDKKQNYLFYLQRLVFVFRLNKLKLCGILERWCDWSCIKIIFFYMLKKHNLNIPEIKIYTFYFFNLLKRHIKKFSHIKKNIMTKIIKKLVIFFNACYDWAVKISLFYINNCYSKLPVVIPFVFYLINLQEYKIKELLTKKNLKKGFETVLLILFCISTIIICIITIVASIAIWFWVARVIRMWWNFEL
jgi:hypothetical protein